MESKFLQLLQEGKCLVADGATGTNLQQRGLARGMPGEVWVLEHPEQILQLHKDFIAAGADIILTCSFGGTSVRLEHAGLADRAGEVNRRAAQLARQAVEGTSVLVAGSMGPTGQLLKPLGPLEEQVAQEAFAAQAQALAEGGVDLLLIETQFDLTEAAIAVRAVLSVTSLPVVVSFSYDRGTRTMMGVRPVQMAKEMESLGVAALGINCGRSLEDNFKALQELRSVASQPIWFKPNAGLPTIDADGQPIYTVTPEQMAAEVPSWLAAGAQIVGGCCGTSPEHLAAIAQTVKSVSPG
jgi:5-methyltetrahydrofolate--homocysteine methyltransferase